MTPDEIEFITFCDHMPAAIHGLANKRNLFFGNGSGYAYGYSNGAGRCDGGGCPRYEDGTERDWTAEWFYETWEEAERPK